IDAKDAQANGARASCVKLVAQISLARPCGLDQSLARHCPKTLQLRLRRKRRLKRSQKPPVAAGRLPRATSTGQFARFKMLRVRSRSEEHTSELQSLAYLV